MRERRRDKRNRILYEGESQRADGRYRYKHKHKISGEIINIYSWKLEETDKLPSGKRDCVALRTRIKQIRMEEEQGLRLEGSKKTVYELCKDYIEIKMESVTPNTRAVYKTVLNTLQNEVFGQRQLNCINDLEARKFLANLQKRGKGYSSIQNIRGVLRPAFSLAVRNNLIIRNVFDFPLSEVVCNDSQKRDAVTHNDKERFLEFVAQSKNYAKYLDIFIILFETGMRISELCGLTFEDVDLNKRLIYVNHILQRDRDGRLYICQHGRKATGKTKCSTRCIPLSGQALEAFKRVYENRPKLKEEIVIDQYKGFIFINTNAGICRPYVAMDVQHHMKHAIQRYNKTHDEPIAVFTPHCCRHTFCTKLVQNNIDITSVKYLMGHGDVSTTLGIYAHCNSEKAIKDFYEKVNS